MLPEFLTFTGLDDHADLAAAAALARLYPIEWGVLLSPSRQGVDARYPRHATLRKISWSGLSLAAHLCGGYARAVMAGETLRLPVDIGVFQRVQVNHAAPVPAALRRLQKGDAPRVIAQTQGDVFPEDDSIDWLYDCSGGRGASPLFWPLHPGRGRRVGYAGGIGPDNVRQTIDRIGADGPYWLDMETGVRTAENRLSLDLCRRVCENVYGPRKG